MSGCSETDSSSNTYSSFEEKSDNVPFYSRQIVEKIAESKVDVTFKDAVEMFKDDTETLKEYIYIKRRHLNEYYEIKASISKND